MGKPFVKWLGGKRKLLPQLRPLLPKGVEGMQYKEPFVGGGAMFFDLQPKQALLADANGPLVETYNAIKRNPSEVIEWLEFFRERHSEAFFLMVRRLYNEGVAKNQEELAAQFLYLNRTCFNGLYRVNKAGDFNAHIGGKKGKAWDSVDVDTIMAAHEALRTAKVIGCDFRRFMEKEYPPREGDFIFMDPPYHRGFVGYTRAGFSDEDQVALWAWTTKASRRGAKVMLCNSSTPLTRDLYALFNVREISSQGTCSVDGKTRSLVTEIVVTNY